MYSIVRKHCLGCRVTHLSVNPCNCRVSWLFFPSFCQSILTGGFRGKLFAHTFDCMFVLQLWQIEVNKKHAHSVLYKVSWEESIRFERRDTILYKRWNWLYISRFIKPAVVLMSRSIVSFVLMRKFAENIGVVVGVSRSSRKQGRRFYLTNSSSDRFHFTGTVSRTAFVFRALENDRFYWRNAGETSH